MKRALLFSSFVFLFACGSDSSGDATSAAAGAGGSGAGGGSAGTGGAAGSGGNAGSNGVGGVGGSSGAGGSSGSGVSGSGGAGGAGGSGNGGDAGSGGSTSGAAGVGGTAGTGGAGGGTSAFALTSSGVMEGMVFPATYTCGGKNVSPPLAWAGAPAGTKSYAIVVTDMSNKLIHWAAWDIPATVLATPEAIQNVAMPPDPAGMLQVKSYDNKTFGYQGPCPGGTEHTYQFALYALDVDMLPGVTTASTRPQVETAVKMHVLGEATLTGKSSAPKLGPRLADQESILGRDGRGDRLRVNGVSARS
jgi:hypothetical protein